MEKKEKKSVCRSIIELIVVVAIMAILTAVLAPTLSNYVDKERAKQDVEATNKIVHTIEIAMANQEIYDEVMAVAHESNVAGYDTEKIMKGITITFEPAMQEKTWAYYPPEAVVNKFVGETGQLRRLIKLNNYVQQNIGDEVEIMYYTDTEYTVFIKMGKTKNEVEVYGAFDVQITE